MRRKILENISINLFVKNTYDSLTSQYRELLELRYPERKEERVKKNFCTERTVAVTGLCR